VPRSRAPILVGSLFAILIAAGLDSRTAIAEPKAGEVASTPLRESLSGPAREAYAAAVVLLNNQDAAGALEKYRQAYDLSKDPRLLFDMAVCQRDLRAYAQMQGLLLRYEQEAGDQMSAQQKADVEAALAAIRDLVGTLHLSVSEAGAGVSLDGEPVGISPLAAPVVVNLGKHALRVTKDGFELAEQAIEIAGGNEMSLSVVLVRLARPALFRVQADPGATIVIDRKELAHGSFDGALAPGAHQVQVTEPGMKGYETRVDLADGESRALQVTLEAERHALLWPWIAGGAAILVGASVGGYFLFRPQDTRGPGPQGQLPTVQIPAGAN
jgi:hypothetical protein